MKKKLISLLLVLALVFSNSAFAVAAENDYLTEKPTVTISAEMTGTEAMGHIGDENSIFLDLRAAEDYAAGHIKGTVSAPVCLPASQDYKVPVANRDAFVEQMKGLGVAENNTTIYLHCYAGTFCVDYAANWLMEKCDVKESQLVRVLGGTFGDAELAAASIYTNLDYALEASAAGTGLILDVRATDTYYADGYLDGSLHQPLFKIVDGATSVTTMEDDLATNFAAFAEANKELLSSKNVYILCNSGARGAQAATTLLANAGIKGNVFTIENGAKGLKANHPELLVNQNTKTAEETVAVSGTSTTASANTDKVVILDVRTVENYNIGHVKGAISTPVFTTAGVTNCYDDTAKAFLEAVEANKAKIAEKDIYIVCNSGARGAQAATKLLMQAGYSNSKIFTVTGGAKALAAYQTFVSPAQAYSVVNNDAYVIFDVRAVAKYEVGTLPGSVSLPLYGDNGLTTGSDELAEAFNKYVDDNKTALEAKKIYILCNSGESIARKASELLTAKGFTNFFTIDGGAAAYKNGELVSPPLTEQPSVTITKEMSGAEAMTHIGDENAIFLDLRAAEDYAAGHIKGTVSAPVCLPASQDYKVPTANRDAFVKQMKELGVAENNTTIYLHCYAGTFCVNYAADWLMNKCGVDESQLVRVLKGTFGDADLAAASIYTDLDYALEASAAGTGLILDVRATDTYYADGYLDGSLHQPLFKVVDGATSVTTMEDDLATNFTAFANTYKDLLKSKNIYILCNSGARGAQSATTLLANAGITGNVFTIENGAKGLKANHPELLVKQNTKTAEETIAVSGTATTPSANTDKVVILDVRTVENYNIGHVKGAISTPVFTTAGVTNCYDDTAKAFLEAVEANKAKIAEKDIYIVCNSGARGAQAATKLLMMAGYSNSKIFTVTGGAKALAEWQTFVSPAQAYSVAGNSEYVILDVRAAEKFAAGSLPGAVSAPLFTVNAEGKNVPTNLEDDLAEAFRAYLEANKETLVEKTIYILCNSGESGARNASTLLAEAGLTKYFTIDGGAAAYKNNELVRPAAPKTVSLSTSTYTFNGKEKKPTVTVKDTKGKKISNEFYTVEYTDNVNAGKGTVKVTFTGKYASFEPMTKTFTIKKAKSSSIKVADSSVTYTGEEIIPQFKTSAGVLLTEDDYTITSIKKNVNVGKATVKVKFKGNVSSVSKTYTFKIVPVGTKFVSVTPGKKTIRVKWEAQKEQTSGYQVRYSTYSSFKKYSTKTISSKYTSSTITNRSTNKTYYVKIRTYKKVSGKKYYSDWSDVVKVKTVDVTKVIKAALADENSVVLDARTQDAYSGWSTETNKLGGHIDGAKNFSASWLTCAYNDNRNPDDRTREERLEIAMADKGITEDTKVIIYDENGKDAVAVADYLASKGVKDIQTFNLKDWTGKLVKYENYETILPPSVVKKLIDGKTVKEVGKVTDLKILEFSWGDEEQSGYLDGHVPTAIHINSDDVDNENYIYILDDDNTLFETVKNAGVTVDSTVVVTGEGLFAAHLATILKYIGIEDVYIMSGGASGWTDAGYEAETKSNKPVPVEHIGTDRVMLPDYIDTVDEVTVLLADPNAQVVDTRAYKEYVGDYSGYSYVYSAGRLNGAIFGQEDGSAQGPNCNGSSMMYYENIDGTMRDASEILEMWENSGVDVNKHLSFYCGGGYRAAAVMWYAQAMGLEETSLYNDGWAGWIVYRKDAVKGTYENPQPAEYSAEDPAITK